MKTSKKDLMAKATNIGMATAAGGATRFITKKLPDLLTKQNIKVDAKIIQAAPLVGAFFLLDMKGMEPAAYGICGAAGVGLGESFGLFEDINDDINDDINGLFEEDIITE